MEFDTLSNRVIGCAIEVHKTLGPGLLESVYERCLSFELTSAGLNHKVQAGLPILYKGIALDNGYRMDILIEDNLVLEIKAVEKIMPIHQAQLHTYLKLARINAGLIINFNVSCLKDGIKRHVI